VTLKEEGGRPKLLGNPVGRSAMATQEWKETDLAKLTANQKLPLKVKNPNLLSKLYVYPA
jgi:hypothetical protein